MASVTSTYARALVDVVLDKRLDATKTRQELHALGALLAENTDFSPNSTFLRERNSCRCWLDSTSRSIISGGYM